MKPGGKTYRIRLALTTSQSIEVADQLREKYRTVVFPMLVQRALEHFIETGKVNGFLESVGLPQIGVQDSETGTVFQLAPNTVRVEAGVERRGPGLKRSGGVGVNPHAGEGGVLADGKGASISHGQEHSAKVAAVDAPGVVSPDSTTLAGEDDRDVDRLWGL